MKSNYRKILLAVLLFTSIVGLIYKNNINDEYRLSPEQLVQHHADIKTDYSLLPLRFEKNQGQTSNIVKYLSRGPGYTLYLTNSETVISLQASTASSSTVIRSSLLDSNSPVSFEGQNTLPGKVNYFIGRNYNDRINPVSTFESVIAKNVYPGIDLRYHGDQQQLEYDFIVGPGINTYPIKLHFDGIDNLIINDMGDLELHAGNNVLLHKKPIVYQDINGERLDIDAQYRIADNNNIMFSIGSYDRNHELIIDPILDYSTYLGGEGNDKGLAIAVDDKGSAYIAGTTKSLTFPIKNGAQENLDGSRDAFIVKLTPDGNDLEYATYIGGSEDEGESSNDDEDDSDTGKAIAIDNQGNAYLTGTTASKDDFPIINAIQPDYGGGPRDAYVVKLSQDGSELIYSTFLGGKKEERGLDIAVTTNNEATITGVTHSKDFPTLSAIKDKLNGDRDAFITQLSSDGLAFNFSSYIGGEKTDKAKAIALDENDNIYITGWTRSKKEFPVTPNAAQSKFEGSDRDTFVLKLDSDGQNIAYATYLGGNKRDVGTGIAVNKEGNAVVTGWTRSNKNFPISVNALQPVIGKKNKADAFVTQLDNTGSNFLFSTYLGGEKKDKARDIAIASDNSIWIAGLTNSDDFPVIEAIQSTKSNKLDAFITQLNSDGSDLLFSSYYGGNDKDRAHAIAVDQRGSAYIAGTTLSDNDFPVQNALQPFFGGGKKDAFVVKFGSDVQHIAITSTPITIAYVNETYTYEVIAEDTENHALSYSLITSPDGMTIDPVLGNISWRPNEQGIYDVEVEVIDGLGNFDYQVYSISVPNRVLEITSMPITEGHVTDFYTYNVIATDPDNDALTYTLSTAPEGMSIDPAIGLIGWTEPVVGSYQISAQVEDGNGGTDTQDFTLTITDEPVITSAPAILTFANVSYSYDVQSSDPNDLILSYQLINPPEGMTIDATTGEIDWVPTTAGDYAISITVENELTAQASQSFVLKVLGENDLLIVSEPEIDAYVGVAYSYELSVIGNQTDNLNYALVNPPNGVTINQEGLLEWTPQENGNAQIQITVSNNQGGSDTQTFTVSVKTLEEMDAMFTEIWNGLFQDLIDGDKNKAMQRLSSDAQFKYGPVFDALLPFIEEIADDFSTPQRSQINNSVAEYITKRTIDGQVKIFFLYYVRDTEGNWKLTQM